ncbi:MAG: TonB-dependent receptor [Nitrospirota bacterium]|nr:TonB-dependent receptor [Nitrospirota bacterium]
MLPYLPISTPTDSLKHNVFLRQFFDSTKFRPAKRSILHANPQRSTPASTLLSFLIFVSALLWSACNSWAEDIPLNTLEPIVVTASPIPLTYLQASASVTVITKSEIEHQQANRLATILQQVPGVFVDEMGGRGGTSSLYVRGGDPNFTLVMLDGIPLNDSSNQRGGSVDLATLTPERIARIEVVRGPASVQYGSDAMAGVINIITHTGQEQAATRAQIEGGEFGYVRGVLHTDGTNRHLRYSGTAAVTRNDDLANGDRFTAGNVGGSFEWSKYEGIHLRFTSQYSNTTTRLFPEGSGGSRSAILRNLEHRHTDELVAGFTLSQDLTHQVTHELSANVFYRQQDVDNPGVKRTPATFEIPPTTFTTTFTRYRLGWTVNAILTSGWKMASGWQIITEQGKRTGTQELTALGFPADSSTAFNATRATPAGFMEILYSPIPQMSLTVGTRIDGPEGFPITVNPRAGLSIHATLDTIVRANYGHGFKLPSFNALSDPLTGNASLNPESSRTWDVGLQQNLWSSRFTLELTYFHNRFKDLIDLDPILANQGTFTLVNLDTVVTHGVEVGFTALPLPTLTIKGSLTYMESNIGGSGAVLRNRPRISGSMVIESQPLSALTIRGQVRGVGRRTDFQVPTRESIVPGYIRTDVSATYGVTQTWSIFGVIENLLNASYEEYAGFSSPGIWFRFGLSYVYED